MSLIAAFGALALAALGVYGVMTSVLATLLIVALFASWIPARGVLRVDPVTTLRAD